MIYTLNDLVSYICVYLNDVYTFQFIFKTSISAKCLNIAEFLHSSQDNSNQGYLKKTKYSVIHWNLSGETKGE